MNSSRPNSDTPAMNSPKDSNDDALPAKAKRFADELALQLDATSSIFCSGNLQLPGRSIREQIDNFEVALRMGAQATDDRATAGLKEYWVRNPGRAGKGMYAREITIAPGLFVVGKIHKHHHLNIMSRGDISILTEFGAERYRGHNTVVSRPGSKRIGFTHEETVWTTIHSTDEVDAARIEAQFIAATHEEYENFTGQLILLEGS
jgi:hypothetical protein